MKRIFYRALLLTTALCAVSSGCSKDNEPDTSTSVIKVSTTKATVFDQWLKQNYVDAYNIDLKYRLEDNLVDRNKNLVPSTLENSLKMATLIQHGWLGVYDEVAGVDFLRSTSPRVIHLIGSNGWNDNGTVVLGTAEDGVQVTLYNVNNINLTDPTFLSEGYFHTMHHEYAHILHQQKAWPTEFNDISRGDYISTQALGPDYAKISIYAPKGFVTAYSRTNSEEDITEVTACYIGWSDKQWETLYKAAGEEGSKKIRQKVEIVRNYTRSAWHIDIDQLRDVARRRNNEIFSPSMVLIQEDWKPLLTSADAPRSLSAVGAKLSAQQLRAVSGVGQSAESVDPRLLESLHRLERLYNPQLGGGAYCQVATQLHLLNN